MRAGDGYVNQADDNRDVFVEQEEQSQEAVLAQKILQKCDKNPQFHELVTACRDRCEYLRILERIIVEYHTVTAPRMMHRINHKKRADIRKTLDKHSAILLKSSLLSSHKSFEGIFSASTFHDHEHSPTQQHAKKSFKKSHYKVAHYIAWYQSLHQTCAFLESLPELEDLSQKQCDALEKAKHAATHIRDALHLLWSDAREQARLKQAYDLGHCYTSSANTKHKCDLFLPALKVSKNKVFGTSCYTVRQSSQPCTPYRTGQQEIKACLLILRYVMHSYAQQKDDRSDYQSMTITRLIAWWNKVLGEMPNVTVTHDNGHIGGSFYPFVQFFMEQNNAELSKSLHETQKNIGMISGRTVCEYIEDYKKEQKQFVTGGYSYNDMMLIL